MGVQQGGVRGMSWGDSDRFSPRQDASVVPGEEYNPPGHQRVRSASAAATPPMPIRRNGRPHTSGSQRTMSHFAGGVARAGGRMMSVGGGGGVVVGGGGATGGGHDIPGASRGQSGWGHNPRGVMGGGGRAAGHYSRSYDPPSRLGGSGVDGTGGVVAGGGLGGATVGFSPPPLAPRLSDPHSIPSPPAPFLSSSPSTSLGLFGVASGSPASGIMGLSRNTTTPSNVSSAASLLGQTPPPTHPLVPTRMRTRRNSMDAGAGYGAGAQPSSSAPPEGRGVGALYQRDVDDTHRLPARYAPRPRGWGSDASASGGSSGIVAGSGGNVSTPRLSGRAGTPGTASLGGSIVADSPGLLGPLPSPAVLASTSLPIQTPPFATSLRTLRESGAMPALALPPANQGAPPITAGAGGGSATSNVGSGERSGGDGSAGSASGRPRRGSRPSPGDADVMPGMLFSASPPVRTYNPDLRVGAALTPYVAGAGATQGGGAPEVGAAAQDGDARVDSGVLEVVGAMDVMGAMGGLGIGIGVRGRPGTVFATPSTAAPPVPAYNPPLPFDAAGAHGGGGGDGGGVVAGEHGSGTSGGEEVLSSSRSGLPPPPSIEHQSGGGGGVMDMIAQRSARNQWPTFPPLLEDVAEEEEGDEMGNPNGSGQLTPQRGSGDAGSFGGNVSPATFGRMLHAILPDTGPAQGLAVRGKSLLPDSGVGGAAAEADDGHQRLTAAAAEFVGSQVEGQVGGGGDGGSAKQNSQHTVRPSQSPGFASPRSLAHGLGQSDGTAFSNTGLSGMSSDDGTLTSHSGGVGGIAELRSAPTPAWLDEDLAFVVPELELHDDSSHEDGEADKELVALDAFVFKCREAPALSFSTHRLTSPNQSNSGWAKNVVELRQQLQMFRAVEHKLQAQQRGNTRAEMDLAGPPSPGFTGKGTHRRGVGVSRTPVRSLLTAELVSASGTRGSSPRKRTGSAGSQGTATVRSSPSHGDASPDGLAMPTLAARMQSV